MKAKTKAIILAAGLGKRMKSALHKLLHPILGKTVIRYVVEAALEAGIQFDDITIVVSPGRDDVKNELTSLWPGIKFALQNEPLGTGHAAQAGVGEITADDNAIILCGDMPLITGELINDLINFNTKNPSDAVVTALYAPKMTDFGRVYSDDSGFFSEIIEARDLKPEHPKTDLVNTGVYFFKGDALIQGLKGMKNDNSQQEYYLTDVPKILKESGKAVRVFEAKCNEAVFTGVNTQAQLADAVKHMQTRINAMHMENGVRMTDPSSVYIDSTVKIAADAIIYPGVILEGDCKIEANAIIGANCNLKDTTVGKKAHIRQSVSDSAVIGEGTQVGPFAYLRPGTVTGKGCRVGNFVEIKNANLGDGVKMAHLSYIGDADVGDGVNYSCGAITANYDGKNKFRTTIEANAFIGSNANLVAPVTVGEGAFVAAGSTITDSLPSEALGIARARQTIKPDWAKPK